MTKQVKYTDHFVADSSVVDEVYYDDVNKELYVILHNGTRVGYSGVGSYIYRALKDSSSVGAYWNRNVKNYYHGISGDVEFVDANAKDAVAEPEFTVVVTVDGTLTITGTATDGNEALRKVNQVLAETFKGTYKVKSLTQNFV